MNASIQPPPFNPPPELPIVVETPAIRTAAPKSTRKPVRRFPWPTVLLVVGSFIAGWLASGVPIRSSMPSAIAYSSEQQIVLDEIRSNVPNPDIEVIEVEQRTTKNGVPIVRVKYRGETPFGGKMVNEVLMMVVDGRAKQFKADWLAAGNWQEAK